MDNLIIFLALFIIVYSFYYLFVVLNKKMLEKRKTGKELTFLKNNYKLDYKKLNIKSLVNVVALSNSFILAFTTTLVCLLNDWIKNFYLWLLACLLMSLLFLIPLIIVIYSLIGTYYSKKQKEKRGN